MHSAATDYLKWHHQTNVWKQVFYRGVRTLGPLEAIRAFVAEAPGALVRDIDREAKFGATFAPEGYYTVA
jgi:cephalosporin hydroxylase